MRSNDDLNATIKAGLERHYAYLGQKIRELAEPLTDEQFWKKPFPFGNSFGHLVLHLTGNLNYYIEAQVAGTGYVRDRDREFTETKQVPKKEAMQRFDQVISLCNRALKLNRTATGVAIIRPCARKTRRIVSVFSCGVLAIS